MSKVKKENLEEKRTEEKRTEEKVKNKKYMIRLKSGKIIIGLGVNVEEVMKANALTPALVSYTKDISTESQIAVEQRIYFVDRSESIPAGFGVMTRKYEQIKRTAEIISEKSNNTSSFVGVVKEEGLKTIEEQLCVAFALGIIQGREEAEKENKL